MEKLKSIWDTYFSIVCTVLLVFLISGVGVLIYRSFQKEEKMTKIEEPAEIKEEEEVVSKAIKVDIKGAVKKPGVYEVSSTQNVSDLIALSGGLTKTADTSNINLSRALEDQMVIKISTKSELKKSAPTNISECVCPNVEITECQNTNSAITKVDGENTNVTNNTNTNPNTTSLISINTATKEQLMTLNSIGEAKALAIIEYRTTHGNFTTIEEIKNVSGIGDALFEKIKDYITI